MMAGIDRFACITVAVTDQDEALRWFTEKLGLQKRVDRQGEGIRFLTVSPRNQPDLQVILASWFPDHIGKNPTAVRYTDDCRETLEWSPKLRQPVKAQILLNGELSHEFVSQKVHKRVQIGGGAPLGNGGFDRRGGASL